LKLFFNKFQWFWWNFNIFSNTDYFKKLSSNMLLNTYLKKNSSVWCQCMVLWRSIHQEHQSIQIQLLYSTTTVWWDVSTVSWKLLGSQSQDSVSSTWPLLQLPATAPLWFFNLTVHRLPFLPPQFFYIYIYI